MSDLVFVASAYGVILGVVAVYAVTLSRRLARARSAMADPPPGSASAPE